MFSPSVWPDAMILVLLMLSSKPAFSCFFFTLIKRLYSISLLYAFTVVWSAYLKLLIFLLAILIPACASSVPAFCMIYSAYKLNKQGDNTLWYSFPNLEPVSSMSGSNSCFLTCIQLLRRQVRWSGIPISLRIFQFVVIYKVKGFSIVSEAELDVFLEFSCFFYYAVDVGNDLWFLCHF